MVIVDRNTRQVRYTDEYYLMKHLSHFVQPGSRLLKVSDHENVLAFRTADNGTAIVTYNPDEDTRFRTFVIDGKKIEGTFRSHQVPLTIEDDSDVKLLESWLRSYHPEQYNKNE